MYKSMGPRYLSFMGAQTIPFIPIIRTYFYSKHYNDDMKIGKLCCDQRISDFVSTGSDILSFKAGICSEMRYCYCYKFPGVGGIFSLS